MASSADPWVREYGEAARLADDVAAMVADRAALPQSGPEVMRHTSAIRRKITILGTRLDSLEGMLARLPPKSMYVPLARSLAHPSLPRPFFSAHQLRNASKREG